MLYPYIARERGHLLLFVIDHCRPVGRHIIVVVLCGLSPAGEGIRGARVRYYDDMYLSEHNRFGRVDQYTADVV